MSTLFLSHVKGWQSLMYWKQCKGLDESRFGSYLRFENWMYECRRFSIDHQDMSTVITIKKMVLLKASLEAT
jgi:hypothetical protein